MNRWLHRLLAVLAGAAAALARPPFGFLPGLLGYGMILWLTDRAAPARPLRSAFFVGWLAGCAYFAISLWWVAEAFYVDAEEQGWMAPFAVAFLAAGLALFWGAATALYRALAARGVRRALLFAGAMAAFEWVRGHVLTGLPWDLAGETWKAGSAPSQAASLFGAYGLGWITVAIFAGLSTIREGPRGRAAAVASLAALAALFAYGEARLAHTAAPAPGAPLVRVVQADVKQENKYDQRAFSSIVARYVALTARPAVRRPDIVVWPEGAIPAAVQDYLAPGAWPRTDIMSALTPGQTLTVGGYRLASHGRAFNSVMSVGRTADGLSIDTVYDKHRLVPFGEYMPLDGVASRLGIKQMVHVGDGFDAGPPPAPIAPPGIPPVQPLICYESLFPGFTREGATASGLHPAWIVNVSNDAWFGATSGPWQHLNIASYRAIEEGLPMVRATPTGVSAIINSYGRVAPGQQIGHGGYGVIDAPLPPPAPTTLFARFGDAFFWLFLALSLGGVRLPWRAASARPGATP